MTPASIVVMTPSEQSTETAQPDLAAAIARIEESRASHQAWAEHMVDCAHCAEHGPPRFIQTREEHEQIVAQYDSVLAILRAAAFTDADFERISEAAAADAHAALRVGVAARREGREPPPKEYSNLRAALSEIPSPPGESRPS